MNPASLTARVVSVPPLLQDQPETCKKKLGWEILERKTSSMTLVPTCQRKAVVTETIALMPIVIQDLSDCDEYHFIVHATDPFRLEENLSSTNFLSENSLCSASVLNKETSYWYSRIPSLALLLAVDPRAILKTSAHDISSPREERSRAQFIASERARTLDADAQEAQMQRTGAYPLYPSAVWKKLDARAKLPVGDPRAPYGMNPLHTIEGLFHQKLESESFHNEILLLGNSKLPPKVRKTRICGFVMEKALFEEWKQKLLQRQADETLPILKAISQSSLPLLLIKTEYSHPDRLRWSLQWLQEQVEELSRGNQNGENKEKLEKYQAMLYSTRLIAMQYFPCDH